MFTAEHDGKSRLQQPFWEAKTYLDTKQVVIYKGHRVIVEDNFAFGETQKCQNILITQAQIEYIQVKIVDTDFAIQNVATCAGGPPAH